MPNRLRLATTTFTTHGDEVDRNGTIGAAQLLRYLERGRWQAMSSHENPLGALDTSAFRMVVRAQRIRLGVPVTWHESLRMETWLARVGRTSLDFGHVLLRERDGARVCEAMLTGVQIDEVGRPVPLPVIVTPHPDPPPLDGRLLDLHFAAELPPDAWSWQQTIRPSQTDLFRHVNHSRYAELFEDARWFMARAAGEADRPVCALALDYRREAKAGEAVEVRVHARDAVTRDAHLLRDGEVLARAVLQIRD